MEITILLEFTRVCAAILSVVEGDGQKFIWIATFCFHFGYPPQVIMPRNSSQAIKPGSSFDHLCSHIISSLRTPRV